MWREDLVRNCRPIIDGELARLARRSPELGRGELAAIDRTLDELLTRLIVERIGRLAEREPELADRAAALFDPGVPFELSALDGQVSGEANIDVGNRSASSRLRP